MRKLAFILAGALLLSPLTATAGSVCPMMNKPFTASQSEAFSAQPGGCCPQGACDCTIQAPASFPAVSPASKGAGLSFETNPALLPDSALSADPVAAEKKSESESPPGSDKPYKLTAQYRI